MQQWAMFWPNDKIGQSLFGQLVVVWWKLCEK